MEQNSIDRLFELASKNKLTKEETNEYNSLASDYDNKLKEEENERKMLAELSKTERQGYKANKAKEEYYLNKQNEEIENQSKQIKPIPAKYYALLHLVYIEIGVVTDFERNENDQYIKSKIEEYAKKHYLNISFQMFYRTFIETDINNKSNIIAVFGKRYKKKLISISKNDAKIIKHLKNYPD